jgi:hypothetical protein
MARKLKHASSRKSKHAKGRKHSIRKTHRKHSNRRHTRRNRRREGGADMLDGAPVGYHLSGSWPSQMSLGQGADYFKYHEGQHGGALTGAPLSALTDSMLPAALRGPAHVGGIDKAVADVRGLSDAPVSAPLAVVQDAAQGVAQAVKTGGRRKSKKNGYRKNKKGGRRNKSKKSARKNKNKRGGAVLGYAPFPSSGMLLSSPTQYAQAGLNPQWKTDVAFDLSKIRDSQ